MSSRSAEGGWRGWIEVSSLPAEIRGLRRWRRWSGVVVEPFAGREHPATRTENVNAGSACSGPGRRRKDVLPASSVFVRGIKRPKASPRTSKRKH